MLYKGKKGGEREEEVVRINRRGVRCHHTTSTIATPAPGHQYHCQSGTRVPPVPLPLPPEYSSAPHCHQQQWKKRLLETWDRGCDQANLPASQAAPVKTVWSPALVKSGRNQKESKSGKHGYEEGCKYCCRGSRRG